MDSQTHAETVIPAELGEVRDLGGSESLLRGTHAGMPAFARYIHLASRVKPDDAPHAAPAKAKLTKAQKLEYVRRWQQSGMDKRAFSMANGISKNSLTHWQQGRSLEQAGKVRPHSQEVRDRALALHDEGKSRRVIASELGLSDTTVRDWITKRGQA